MPITGPIPLPGSFGEAAFGPSVSPHTMINDILQRQLNQRKLQQAALEAAQLNKHRAAELAETTRAHNLTHQHNMGSLAETRRSHDLTHEYNMRHLAIQRQAEERAQAQLPYVIQNYKDIHNRYLSDNQIKHLKAKMAQREYDSIIQSIMVTPGQPGQSMGQGVPGQPMQPTSPQQQQRQSQQLGSQQQKDQTPQYGGRSSNLANMMRPLFEAGYRTDQNFTPIGAETTLSPQDQLNMQQQVAQQVQQPVEQLTQSPQETQIPQTQQTEGQQPPAPANNGEIVIKQGNPALVLQDKLVGTSFGKPAKTHYANGYVYTEYPSGKITATKSPIQEKLASTRETSEQKFTAREEFEKRKESRKEAERIDTLNEVLIPSMRTIQKLSNILEKKPDLTGKLTSAGHKYLGYTKDEDVGVFAKGALDLQNKMTKDFGNRSGYGIAKIVERGKPDIGHSPNFNKGVLKSMKADSVYSFLKMKKRYEESGKKYPYDIQNIYPTLILRTPEGKNIKLKTNDAIEIIEQDPSYTVEG